MKLAKLLPLLLLTLPAIANAWWDKDYKQRTEVTLNTTDAGVPIKASLSAVTVPVRLHSGNFDFIGTKQDGSDLRVVAADDKTPLKFWVERFDGVNELAILWVQIPMLLPGTDKNLFYVYGGNDKATPIATSADVFDPSTLAAFHFGERDGVAADQTGSLKSNAQVAVEPNGLIGPSAKLSGTAVEWPASEKLRAPAGGAYTVSMWIKPDVAAGELFRQAGLVLSVSNGELQALVDKVSVKGGTIAPATWSQVVLTLGAGKAQLYVNGAKSGEADVTTGAIEGPIKAGDGYSGLLDELTIASAARSAEWVTLAYAAQSADAKLIATKTQTPDSSSESSSGGGGYFGILFKSLTPDAIAVISILGVMFVIAAAVMVTKAMYIAKTDGANRKFLAEFRSAHEVVALDSDLAAQTFANSSLFRVYQAGLRELNKRDLGPHNRRLTGPALDAIRAAIDADSVREGYRLNALMVLLTIAISGGPFLGLLGTVIGVMITFASIAAAGDVNVNAIAPGIAAALLATVAGLGVAIPSLFGYNYLASRIKQITSDMQIFIDEMVTRMAESYGN